MSSHGNGTAWRAMGIYSVPAFHGIRSRGTVYFMDPKPQVVGTVTNVDQPNFNGLTFYAYAWKADYADFYELLRSEAPLYFFFAFADGNSSQPSRQLYSYQLGTAGFEPPGEGSEDDSP
jgi:hypothetical protein